ncbi:hypothetical protein ALP29_200858 [Pseudomonas syringae pv. avii]|uniref:Uncharacterized protein n=1 Tax=Pseudomonas syringae pv. avii TaxID=663959 RepID=A0A3M5VMT7_PSESX|nr:SDR family NAD(P)-dependent oxidoreductase [Pseudomonas azotoformans]RMT64904.1 hypothetical protein ALP43_200067 [Pseudomonas azotoformans]RMU59054.1 hypothetical protein ALP29_200858 [Pseudomonas syringae pv. avii]
MALDEQLRSLQVWINSAMVTVFSPIEHLTVQEIQRVTEVTYLGITKDTLVALKLLRPRNQGLIIQVGSALAYPAIPLQSAYCGAKLAASRESVLALTSTQLPAVLALVGVMVLLWF